MDERACGYVVYDAVCGTEMNWLSAGLGCVCVVCVEWGDTLVSPFIFYSMIETNGEMTLFSPLPESRKCVSLGHI